MHAKIDTLRENYSDLTQKSTISEDEGSKTKNGFLQKLYSFCCKKNNQSTKKNS